MIIIIMLNQTPYRLISFPSSPHPVGRRIKSLSGLAAWNQTVPCIDSHPATIWAQMPILPLSLTSGWGACVSILGFTLVWRLGQCLLFPLGRKAHMLPGRGKQAGTTAVTWTCGSRGADNGKGCCPGPAYLFLLKTSKMSFLVKKHCCVKVPRKIIQCYSIRS